jgi:hypothetical protein
MSYFPPGLLRPPGKEGQIRSVPPARAHHWIFKLPSGGRRARSFSEHRLFPPSGRYRKAAGAGGGSAFMEKFGIDRQIWPGPGSIRELFRFFPSAISIRPGGVFSRSGSVAAPVDGWVLVLLRQYA